jgi:hypothetical protein
MLRYDCGLFYWFLKSDKNSGFFAHIFRDELHCITEADISRELDLAGEK